jgi:CDP-6-deoxy-D-xylo-4-hexulose-3-dehydrase
MVNPDPNTYAMSAPSIEQELIKKRNSYTTDIPLNVLLVHVLGVPADMTEIMRLQDKYKFNLMEDCCASHGAMHKGKKVGTFGCMSSFSFYYGHHMSTIEGGMVCTNDTRLYEMLLMLRSHGWLKDISTTTRDAIMVANNVDLYHSPFLFAVPGFNLRSTDLNAHVGLTQLKRLDETVAIRNRNHLHYQKLLNGTVDFQKQCDRDHVSIISFLAVAKSIDERKRIIEALVQNGIDTRIFTAGNLGRHPFWKNVYYDFVDHVSDKLNRGGFFLPNNQSMTLSDVEFVCDIVNIHADRIKIHVFPNLG